jgi:hypothetical protein
MSDPPSFPSKSGSSSIYYKPHLDSPYKQPATASLNSRFAFPSLPSSSRLATAISSDGPLPPAQTTTRFHEALAAHPTSARRPPQHSRGNSNASNDSTQTAFRFPPDSASPTGARSFGHLQRELGNSSRSIGDLQGQEDFRLIDEDERFEKVVTSPPVEPEGGRERGRGRQGGDDIDRGWRPRDYHSPANQPSSHDVGDNSNNSQHMEDYRSNEAVESMVMSMGGMIGRPASMDMGNGNGMSRADTSMDEGDTSSNFLKSPPFFDPTPSSVSTSTSATASSPPARPFGLASRANRTFPLPMLLKGDRPFGISGRPAQSTSVSLTSLAPPRKLTASHFPNTHPLDSSPHDILPSPPLPASSIRPLWISGTSSSPVPSAQPPITMAESYPNPPFRRQHYREPSSTSSSLSQEITNPARSFDSTTSGAAARHSPQPSLSSAATDSPQTSISIAPPATVSDPALSFSLSSSQSIGAPLSTSGSSGSGDPPIGAQSLLLYILSLRSSASSTSNSIPRSTTSSQLPKSVSHARIQSLESSEPEDSRGGEEEDEEDTTLVASIVSTQQRLDTVDLSHKRIAEVPLDVIMELRDEVEKLALGYNLLKELPNGFGELGGRLRYLNIRVNLLTVFPQVVGGFLSSLYGR